MTCLACAADNRPSDDAAEASIAAILAVRMMEGTGQARQCQVGDRWIVGPAPVSGAGDPDDLEEAVKVLEASRRDDNGRARLPGRPVRVRERHPDHLTRIKGPHMPRYPLLSSTP